MVAGTGSDPATREGCEVGSTALIAVELLAAAGFGALALGVAGGVRPLSRLLFGIAAVIGIVLAMSQMM